MVKWKLSAKGDFFRKISEDVVFDSESNDSIFDALALFSGELWRFVNLYNIIEENVKRPKIDVFGTQRILLNLEPVAVPPISEKYHNSTQNQKQGQPLRNLSLC